MIEVLEAIIAMLIVTLAVTLLMIAVETIKETRKF